MAVVIRRRSFLFSLVVDVLFIAALVWAFTTFAPMADKAIREYLGELDSTIAELGVGDTSLLEGYEGFIDYLQDGLENLIPDGCSMASAEAQALEAVQVTRIVDGDTIGVETGSGAEETVRLIGVDTPESVSPDESENCAEGELASAYTASLLDVGSQVYLERDVSDEDTYGRKLRYVWLEEPTNTSDTLEVQKKMLNAILVDDGYADAVVYEPDSHYSKLFASLELSAVQNGRGVSELWSS